MRHNKKAFTVVELVIVIAIIALLAAVLIPTFIGVVKKANEANARAEAKNLITEMLADILLGKDGDADLLVFSEKGSDVYAYAYSRTEGRVISYKNNPRAKTGAFEDTVKTMLTEMVGDVAITECGLDPEDWRQPEKIKDAVKELNTKGSMIVYANYTINADKFAKEIPALPTPEKTAIEKANEAIKNKNYAGESITEALAAIGGLDVDTLVYKENGEAVATKTYAYDPAKKEFIVVDLTDTNLSSDLVYIVNADTAINSKMTKIYINTAKDNAIARANFVSGKYFKAKFTMVEIGGSVAKVGSKDDWRAGDGCFYGCSTIQKVYIGSSVKEIGSQTFGGIKDLNYVYYNAGVETAENIGKSNGDTRQFKGSGTNVTLVYGKDVKVIPGLFGGEVGDGKQVKSITFEDGIKYTEILDYAFKNFTCLTEITLPSTCQRIGSTKVFECQDYKSQLKKVVWSGGKITVGGTEYYEGANLNQGSPANLAYYLARKTGARDNVLDLVVGNTTYKAKNFGGYIEAGNRVPDNMTVEVYENGVLTKTYEYKSSTELQEKNKQRITPANFP